MVFCSSGTNNREIGSLEAADTLLGHSLYGVDKETMVKWLDIRQTRNRKLKTFEDIKKLNENSTDIFCNSFIDSHNPNRPDELETTSLYDFAKYYDVINYKPKNQERITFYPMKEGKLYARKRTKYPYLINHWKNNPSTEPENY